MYTHVYMFAYLNLYFLLFDVEEDIEQEQEEGEDGLEGDFSQTLPPPISGQGARVEGVHRSFEGTFRSAVPENHI